MSAPVAFTMSSGITEALFQQIGPLQNEIPLDPYGAVLLVANSLSDIATGKAMIPSEAYMCACRREKIVLVWGDSAQGIISHGSDVETRLVGLVSILRSSHALILINGSGLGKPNG